MEGNINSCDLDSVKYATLSNHDSISPQNSVNNNNNKFIIERESKSLVDLTAPIKWVRFIFGKDYFFKHEYAFLFNRIFNIPKINFKSIS